jgi:predicted unusual protein kinase regulating ubiquinone biosynthesis (AarF/ABC1/UbiB family)
MRGAAMKAGQMISMVELDGLPDDQRRELQTKLASLRDSVPPVPFPKLEEMMRKELGGPLTQTFSDFEEQAFAAASIGQVHRAVTVAGDEVAVKVQYPGVAEAVETDMRNAMLLLPLVKRLAPGLDTRSLFNELRERVGEELDYELEAQNQRRVGRRFKNHPFIFVPRVHTSLSTRRILVTEYVAGERYDAVKTKPETERDRYAEIVFRFYFGLAYRDGIALGDPHPGNYLLRSDGKVAFLDYGLLRDVSPQRIEAERTIAGAVRDKNPEALKAALVKGGYLPPDRADVVDPNLALRMMRRATRWYAAPGFRRFGDDEQRRGRNRERDANEQPATDVREQMNQFTLPPETVLIRRMHGIVGVVLWQLRAGADWGAIAAEYLHGAPPATPLGEAEAEADHFKDP